MTKCDLCGKRVRVVREWPNTDGLYLCNACSQVTWCDLCEKLTRIRRKCSHTDGLYLCNACFLFICPDTEEDRCDATCSSITVLGESNGVSIARVQRAHRA